MTGQNRIIALEPGTDEERAELPSTAQVQGAETTVVNDSDDLEVTETFDASPADSSYSLAALPAGIAVISALAWSGFFGWANWSSLRDGLDPLSAAAMIGDWAVPMMLIGVAWLLVMRTSRKEAKRFGDTALLLSRESERLETRLLTVNRELSLAREFIASQSRDLEALGRIASDRLSDNAQQLQALISENGDRVELLGTVSEAALENMEKLRGQLPVITSSAKDVTNNIANAGRVAHAQIEEMASGFRRLNEFGQACGREVRSLRETTAETIEEFQRHCSLMEEAATSRFAAIAEKGAELRTQLEMHEIEALAAIRTRAATLGAEIAETTKLLASGEEDALASLKSRLTALRDDGGALSVALSETGKQALDDWKSKLGAFDTDCNEMFSNFEQSLERVADAAQLRLQEVDDNARRIDVQLAESGQSFESGLTQLREEAEASNSQWIATLSERFQAVSREISEQGQKLRRELDGQHEELAARHLQALAELNEKSATLDGVLAERAGTLLSQIEQNKGRLDESHAGLLASLTGDFDALENDAARRSEWISAEIKRRRQEFADGEEKAVASLRELLTTVDEEIAERLLAHERQEKALAQRAEQLTAEFAEQERQLGEVASRSEETQTRISESLQSITSGIFHAQSLLTRTDREITELTDASVRLLELVKASVDSTQSELPDALDQSEKRLAALETAIGQVRKALDGAARSGEVVSGHISASNVSLSELVSRSEELTASIENHGDTQANNLAGLLKTLEELDSSSEQFASKAREQLSEALDTLATSANQAVSAIGEKGASQIADLAGRLGAESAEAIDRAIRNTAAEASGKLEQAAAHAAGVSREAIVQLRDQLAKVNELVSNLEQRVAHARERAEDQVDNDFSRRVALITESLNSNSIDIAKAMSTDVSDTAWASYLRGDRGVFTRRAVSLIEANDAKAIQQIYERDRDFREHVSRYIHDFEAILRQVLSTKDGHALGVTLLSSDMGKLYVALAQGIERLRD